MGYVLKLEGRPLYDPEGEPFEYEFKLEPEGDYGVLLRKVWGGGWEPVSMETGNAAVVGAITTVLTTYEGRHTDTGYVAPALEKKGGE